MYAGEQPLFAQPSLVKKKKEKEKKNNKRYITTHNGIANIGDTEIDLIQVHNILRLKLSPAENDVLPLIFCEVIVVARLCYCTELKILQQQESSAADSAGDLQSNH